MAKTTGDGFPPVADFPAGGHNPPCQEEFARVEAAMNPRDVLDKPFDEAFSLFPSVISILKQAKDREFKEHEVSVRTRRGTTRCLVTTRILRDADGEFIGMLTALDRMDRVRSLVHRMVGAHARFTFDDIVGRDPALVSAVKLARAAARTECRILLHGESGTGKELFAQAIHNESARKDGPFVAINCGAVPTELIESELFGYEEGAFTGARRGGKPGRFELTEGGTFFLDELESMPLEMQVKLLRALKDDQVVRVGGTEVIPVNVRIVGATKRDLLAEVRAGRFREDLYYRLNVVNTRIPPLRERASDIPLLVSHFLERLQVSRLPFFPANDVFSSQAAITTANSSDTARFRHTAHADDNVMAPSHESTRSDGPPRSIKEVERAAIVEALRDCQGNLSRAARVLGIGRSTLHRKVKRYCVVRPSPEAASR